MTTKGRWRVNEERDGRARGTLFRAALFVVAHESLCLPLPPFVRIRPAPIAAGVCVYLLGASCRGERRGRWWWQWWWWRERGNVGVVAGLGLCGLMRERAVGVDFLFCPSEC